MFFLEIQTEGWSLLYYPHFINTPECRTPMNRRSITTQNLSLCNIISILLAP